MNGTKITEEVYQLINLLPRLDYETLSLDQQTARLLLPENGIDVVFEKGEVARSGLDRIVRIGSNRENGNLRSRLRSHYCDAGTSIFRWHVCCALLNRQDPADHRLNTIRPYKRPELRPVVSQVMRETFTFSCFEVDDQSERSALEQRLIAQLAKQRLGEPSSGWLGKYAVKLCRNEMLFEPAPNDKIRTSGLWNEQHIFGEPLDAYWFGRFEELVIHWRNEINNKP